MFFLYFAGLGFGLAHQPSYVILTYYFDKRLARANGIASAGVGVGIFAIPPFLQVLIDFYGWQSALLIMAAVLGNLGICAAIYRPSKLEIENRTSRPKQKANNSTSFELNYISGMENACYEQDQTTSGADQLHSNSSPGTREHQIGPKSNPKEITEDKTFSQPNFSSQIELHQNDGHPKSTKYSACAKCYSWGLLELFDFQLLTNFNFVLLLMSYFLYGVAYVIAIQYWPVRAVHTGISELNAAYLISAIGISSLLSRLTHGYIIDYHIMSATVLTALAYAISGVSSALNPVSDSYPVLICLSVVVGLTSGVFNSTIPIIAKEYVGAKQVSAGTGLILLIIGISLILGVYVTGVLADATGSYDIPFYLAGACFLICALLIFAFPGIKLLKRHQTGHKDEDDTPTRGDQLEL
ncbi:monocarboxylate transporter 5-like [Amphiura filiformis]|uniref:monocarboxylate transporter 5-like n=1 Tax=Amphiura filiformis TaxID=82378 RepID=UPI003B210664